MNTVLSEKYMQTHHNELYSQIPQLEMFRNVFQVLSKGFGLTRKQVLKKRVKRCLNYSSRFPEGVQKDEF